MLHTHFYHYSKRALTTFYMSICCGKESSKQKSSKNLLQIKKYCLGLSFFSALFSLRKQTRGLGGWLDCVWQNREKNLRVTWFPHLKNVTFLMPTLVMWTIKIFDKYFKWNSVLPSWQVLSNDMNLKCTWSNTSVAKSCCNFWLYRLVIW